MTLALNRKESKLFEEFRSAFVEFPSGIIVETECPDFIIKGDSVTIGIELTEIFQDSSKRGSRLQQASSFGRTFTDELIVMIQRETPFTFFIGIKFNGNEFISHVKRSVLLGNLEKMCVATLLNLENKELAYIRKEDDLPLEIEEIHLGRYDGLQASYNSQPEGGIVSNFYSSHLHKLLQSKECLLTQYKPCDNYWLVIIEGNYYAGSFVEIVVDIPVQSTFDNIFLFRRMDQQIVVLK